MVNQLSPALRGGQLSLEDAARRVWLESEIDDELILADPVRATDVIRRARVFDRRAGDAYDAIDRFEASTKHGVWPKLSKAEIVFGLRRRVLQPWLVEQGPTPFCGPASIVYELARRDPARYVRSVRNLYEIGSFVDARRKRITASRRLRTFPPHGEITEDSSGDKLHWQVPAVDWIIEATLREQANILLNVTGGFDGANALKGATTAWEMVQWGKRILGSSDVEIHRAKPSGEFGIEPGLIDFGMSDAGTWMRNLFRKRDVGTKPAMQAAVRTVAAGGSAMLMLNSRMLTKPATPNVLTSLAPNVATHWVTLVTGHSDLVRFTTTPSLGWSREVALDRPGTGSSSSWRRPVTQLGPGNQVRLSVFTWGNVEFRTMTLAGLRRHLFAVVLAA